MKPPQPGITFGQGVNWAAVSQPAMSRLAGPETGAPMFVRVFLAALGRMDRMGHAKFDKGELALLVGRVDTATGEIVPANKASLSKALRQAKDAGYIEEESNAKCVVLHHTTAQKAKGARVGCQIDAG